MGKVTQGESIPTIETTRLRLRPFTSSDAPQLHAIFSEPDSLRYFPTSGYPTIGGIGRMITAKLDHWATYGYGWWAIEGRGDGRLIGWAGLEWLPDTQETEVAYMLSRTFWGTGLATEAARTSLRFGFETQRLDAIVGIVHPDNIASQRVLEKSGLTCTAITDYFGAPHRRYEISRAGFEDMSQS